MWKFIRKIIHKSINHTHFYYNLWPFRHPILCGNRSSLVYNCRNYTSNKYIRILFGIIVAPINIFRYFFPEKIFSYGRKGLAFVLIAKNEAAYIKEWINFHLKQGASNFIIYDNESTDNLYDVLKPYIESGLVFYHKIVGKIRQHDAYNMAMQKYKYKFKYIAVLDADEFVFVRNLNNGGGGITSINL